MAATTTTTAVATSDGRGRLNGHDDRGRRDGCKGREGLSEYCEPLARFFAL